MSEVRDLDPRSSNAALYAFRTKWYREREGLSQCELGATCNVSGKTISAIENLRRPPTLDVSQKQDRLHGLNEFFEDLYWQVLREMKLSPRYLKYAVLEEQASIIRTYNPLHVPGLLQIEGYVRAIIGAVQPLERREQHVGLRLARQDILAREEPPQLVVVIKEQVLREVVGCPEVMRAQLDHLLEVGQSPNITIHVIKTGTPTYVPGIFNVLGFEDGPDLGYSETPLGGATVEAPGEVNRLAINFDQVRGAAESAAVSAQLIRLIMEAL